MKNEQDKKDQNEVEANNDGQTAPDDSGEDEYKRDESNRGEREGHLRQRSDWFQKRTGG
jgi:hypothetical protein